MKFVFDREEHLDENSNEFSIFHGARVVRSGGPYGLARDVSDVFELAQDALGSMHPDERDAWKLALAALLRDTTAKLRPGVPTPHDLAVLALHEIAAWGERPQGSSVVEIQKARKALHAMGLVPPNICVSPGGRFDAHGAFRMKIHGAMCCSFCKKPIGDAVKEKRKPR